MQKMTQPVNIKKLNISRLGQGGDRRFLHASPLPPTSVALIQGPLEFNLKTRAPGIKS